MEGNRDESEYTQEQHEAVQNILKSVTCKDNYGVLGLTKSCTDDKLKQAYKKLALIVHPDKNHAPGATEAFKAINNAFDTITEERQRERCASQILQDTTNSRTGSQSHQQHATPDQQQTENWFMTLLKITGVGLVAAAGLYFWKWFQKGDPAYNLQQNSQYITKRTTKIYSVPYFVKTDFLSYYADDIAQIEEQVEREFLDNLLQNRFTSFAR